MSIDRAKALKAAQKYLAKGQIDRAIGEYEKMVAADPADARLQLKLGDLYTRKGDNKGATAAYRKVAQQYAQHGFFLKAVAVYKQILKLEPNDLAASESLAEMYEALSLTSDALSTYEQVADAYVDSGRPEKGITALGKVAELDPKNVAAWIRYAEALSKTDRIAEAATAFRRGADLLEEQGRIDDYIKVAERLLFHSHEQLDCARKLSAIYIERGQAKAALTHLQTCFKADPKDIATLELLARAFRALDQDPKAVSVYKEMSRIHAEAGRAAEEAAALRELLTIEPNDAEARQRLDALAAGATVGEESGQIVLDEELDEVLIVEDDERSASAGLPLAAPLGPQEREAQIARIMAECEVFYRYGLRDKMIVQLNRVLDLDPNHLEAREKLKDALLKRGDVQSAVTQLLLLSESVAVSDAGRASDYLEQAVALNPDNETLSARLAELKQASKQPLASTHEDDDVIVVEDEADARDEADFSDLRSDRPNRSLGPREVSLATALEGSDEPELVFEEGNEEDDETLEDYDAEYEPPVSFDARAQPSRGAPPASVAAAEEPEEEEEDLSEAFEEADFYQAQKLFDEAREVLTEALYEHPRHRALRAKLAELDRAEQAASDDVAGAGGPEDRSFALAQKLAEEAGAVTQGPVEVQQVLQQFKQGVERQVAKSDTATHYDLGIAYMEMGLHVEAIEEFRLCLDKPEKQCTANTMIGLSYVAKGDMANAIVHFKAALEGPVRTPEEELSLWFEIGNASELLGKASEALVWYEKVEERDPAFRDVAARIERLGVLKNAQQEGDEFDAMFDNMILKD